jgi:hypothetical protein
MAIHVTKKVFGNRFLIFRILPREIEALACRPCANLFLILCEFNFNPIDRSGKCFLSTSPSAPGRGLTPKPSGPSRARPRPAAGAGAQAPRRHGDFRPSCARQQFEVIKTVERLEERLAHITTPLTVSVISCVINGPAEARKTDIGLTGGGNGTHQVYISGLTDHRLKDADIVEHLVELVDKKAAEIEAEKRKEAELAAAQ